MKQSIGERVKALRESAGWTQEHLAAASDVSLRTIQRIESDKSDPSPESVQALATAFRCDVSTIRRGLSATELTALQESFLCPTCGARMIEQTTVPRVRRPDPGPRFGPTADIGQQKMHSRKLS
jgi:transcriptional regulator with XRE-family HTH domain